MGQTWTLKKIVLGEKKFIFWDRSFCIFLAVLKLALYIRLALNSPGHTCFCLSCAGTLPCLANLFYFVCMSVLPACMFVCHWCPWRSEEGIRSRDWSWKWLWATMWVAGTEPMFFVDGGNWTHVLCPLFLTIDVVLQSLKQATVIKKAVILSLILLSKTKGSSFSEISRMCGVILTL